MIRLTLLLVICVYLTTIFSKNFTKTLEMSESLKVRDVSIDDINKFIDSKPAAMSTDSRHSKSTEIKVINTYNLDKNSLLVQGVIIDTLVSFVIGSTVPPQDPNGGDIINGGFTIERSGNDPITGNGIDEITRWNFTYANLNIDSSSQVISAQLTLIFEQKDAGASNDFVQGDNCGCTPIFVGLYPLNVIDTVQFEMLNLGYDSQLFIDHILADGFPMFYQDDAIVSFAELKLIISNSLNVLEPNTDELWIAGETDTIKWNGGAGGQFFNIEFSIDSGNTYSVVSIGVPADSGYYIWNIPQNILSTKVKIKISDVADSTVYVESDIFKIKGYVLTRIKQDGNYEQFKSNLHGWNYLNGSLWPQSWWSQFQYSTAIDPYTNAPYPSFFHSVSALNFIDWPLWVEVYSENKCYWSTFLRSYDGDAQVKWLSTTSPHQGSCFGFAASSFLAFNFKDQFFSRHPGIPSVPNIFSLFLNNTIQKTINGYYAYQYGKQSLDNDVIGQVKDPRTTLLEIMNMFKNDSLDIRTITIYNNGGGGGGAHTMAPISVTIDGSGPSRYRVNLYDSNNPGIDTPYILVDSLNNTWTDFTGLGATWTGTNHFYLEIPISNYLNTPIMGDQFLKSPDNIKGINNLEFYNTEKANIIYTSSTDEKIGVVNGVIINEIENGIAIFNKNGKPSDPFGYFIPNDNYSVVLSNITDTSGRAYLSVFKPDLTYVYERWNVNDLQSDKFRIDDGFSVVSPDVEEKQINLTVIAELDSSERILFIKDTQLRQSDSLYVKENNQSEFIIKNYGSAKTYHLELNDRSSLEQEIFEHPFVALQTNSAQTLQPNWDDLYSSQLKILVDLGIDGTIDDTLYIENTVEVKDEGSLLLPNEYNLAQNFPNPFNPVTTIRFSIPQRSNVSLKVYDILGSEVATLVNEEKERGIYSVNFDASQLASGMYLYSLQAGSFIETKKMIFLK